MRGTGPALTALIGGVALSVLLFVPWAAVQYRRRGSLGIGDALIAFGVAVYAVAVVAYTLLPLPSSDAAACAAGSPVPQLQLFRVVADVRREGGLSRPASLLTNPAAAQVLLNVALFVPLGMFVRHLGRRGLASGLALAAVVGLAVSVLIESTQLTGVWGLYACSYRLFDVDDVAANTLGAVAGALVAPLLRLVPTQRSVRPDAPRRVTAGRRLLGMVCDLLGVLLVAGAVSAAVLAAQVLLGIEGERPSDAVLTALGLVPALVQLVLVWTTGRTLGEAVVRLRPLPRPGLRQGTARWLLGIGGWSLLWLQPGGQLQNLLLLMSLVAVFLTRDRRGLAAAVTGQRVVDERDRAAVRSPRTPADDASGSLPR